MKHKNTILPFILACILAFASSAAYSDPVISPVWIKMQRSACFGRCPVYSLTVHRDGTVIFFGEAYTLVKGTQRNKMSDTALEKLKLLLSTSVFADLSVDCCACFTVTDNPTTTLEISDGTRTTKIEHYHGCKDAPKALSDLEDKIDEITEAVQWIGTYEQRRNIRR